MRENNQESQTSRRLFTLLTFVLVIAALHWAKEVLLPLALAILLSFVLTPMVTRIERFRVGRIPAVILVCAVAFSAIGGVGLLATNQIVELSSSLPNYKDNLIGKINNLRSGTGEKLGKAKRALEDIGNELAEGGSEDDAKTAEVQESPTLEKMNWLTWLTRDSQKTGDEEQAVAVKVVEMPPSPLYQIQTWLGPLVAPLSTAGMVVVLVIFILVKCEDLRNRMVQLLGTSRLYATTEAIEDATDRLSRYLRMQLLINVIYGVVVAVGLALIGIPNAILWGVLGTLLRFLPYIGPWIAATMPIALTVAVSEGWMQPLMAVGLFVVLELVVNNALEPWLYGSSVGVSSLGVIVAAIFWTWLWGPIGLVLAMPLTVCLVVLGKYVPQLEFLPVLLGDRSALEPYEHLYQRLLTSDDHEAARLSEDYVKSSTVIDFYDQVVIPALNLAEQDRHAELLSLQQESVVNESARDLVDDLGQQIGRYAEGESTAGGAADGTAPTSEETILCIPVRDLADETSAIMLGQLLQAEGYNVDLASSETLAGETIDHIQHERCRMAFLVMLPPLGTRRARYLCKRLRQRHPDLRIVAVLLNGIRLKKTQQRLVDAGADLVVTSLRDAVAAVHKTQSTLKYTDPTGVLPVNAETQLN